MLTDYFEPFMLLKSASCPDPYGGHPLPAACLLEITGNDADDKCGLNPFAQHDQKWNQHGGLPRHKLVRVLICNILIRIAKQESIAFAERLLNEDGGVYSAFAGAGLDRVR